MKRIALGNLEVDSERFEVRIGGGRIDLTYREYELLAVLMAHPRRVLSAPHLVEEAWGEQGGVAKLRVLISRLRKKIERSHPWRLVTVKHRGYMLTDDAPEPFPANRSHNRKTAITDP